MQVRGPSSRFIFSMDPFSTLPQQRQDSPMIHLHLTPSTHSIQTQNRRYSQRFCRSLSNQLSSLLNQERWKAWPLALRTSCSYLQQPPRIRSSQMGFTMSTSFSSFSCCQWVLLSLCSENFFPVG